MKPNKIKIIQNSQTNTLSYQLQNEQMVWMPISNFSDLTKREYTKTSIQQSATEILSTIDMIYNIGSRGIKISFEGSDKDYQQLRKVVNELFSHKNITCEQQSIKVAIAGKCGSGKTTLIESLAQKQGIKYEMISQSEYQHYTNKSNPIEWFEINGIDLGMEYVEKAMHTVDQLSKHGITLFIYCFTSVRVEAPELQFIQYVKDNYPEISLLGVFTKSVSDDDTIASEAISRMCGIRVLPILAKEEKVYGRVIKAFGHENVLSAICGEV